jgi:tRNA pseudouridine38-40 synthase
VPQHEAGKELCNLKLVIEYDGSGYYGWQRQTQESKKKTVQQVIEESLQVLFPGEKIKLIGAGRTDSGVHAYGQAANFKIPRPKYEKFGKGKLIYSLNSVLPDDIAVKSIRRVKDDFHARFSAKSRVYRYLIVFDKSAIDRNKTYRVKSDLDPEKAREFCRFIEGIHSFKSLCRNKTDAHDFLSDVKYARLKKRSGGILEFEICANRFLHSMVRAIVGSMLGTASGRISLKEFKNKFKKGEDIKIQYVPANALFLLKVNY